MADSIQQKISEIREAIASLEKQRAVMGDVVVDTAIQALDKQISELQPEQQRKQATILMMDIAGHTSIIRDLDPEENMEIIDQALIRLEKPIIEAGGRVTRFTGDGFKAIFGHPEAHDNDPEMAVRAALRIQKMAEVYGQELEEQRGITNFQVRIGIDTGLVVIGGVSEGEDTVKGETVNLAARLETAAPPHGILISGRTERLVHGIFELETLEPLTLKGFDEPIPAFRVSGLREQSFVDTTRGVEGIETPLVGREQEFQELETGMAAAFDETSARLVTITADAGVGKSRLLYEFEQGLSEDVRIFKGRSVRERQSIPYGLFRNLFARHLNIRETDPPSEIAGKFEARIGPVLGAGSGNSRAHFIGQLLGFDFSASPYLEGVLEDAQQLSDRARIYLVEFFSAISRESNVALFMEDIHWADEQSLDLLMQLIDRLNDRPVFVICIARPILFERRKQWGKMNPACSEIKLAPLSRKDSRHLVGEILQKAEIIPLVLREFIVSGAEGNPYYIEELIKMLIENGVIIKHENSWHIEQTRLLELEVPPTLTGIIQARLDSLAALEKMLLQQASVVGRNFWDGILYRINATSNGDSGEENLREALSSLQQKEMVYPQERGTFAGYNEYYFKHNILREVTYESVLKRMRPVYHGLVAEWLIEHSSENAGEFAPMIADHLALAGQLNLAAVYFRRAGEQSLKQYGNEEAIHYLSRALELIGDEDPLERFNILRARIQVFSLKGERQKQKQDLQVLTGLAGELGDDARRGQAALLQAVYASEHSQYPRVIKYAGQAISHGQAAQQALLVGRGHQLWGRALISKGEYGSAREHLKEALSIAQSSGLSQVEADSLRLLGNLAQNQSTPEEAKEYFECALEISRRTGDRRGEGRALNSLGNISLLQDSYEEGKIYFDQFLAISKEIGDRWGQGIVSRGLGDYWRQRGDLSTASQFLIQALSISDETGNMTLDMKSRFNLGTIALDKSEFTEASLHFHNVLQLAKGLGNRPMEARALREIGQLFHRQGDFIRAMNYYRQSLYLFEELNNPRSICRTLVHISLLNDHLSNLGEALDSAQKALDQLKDMNYPRDKAFVLVQLGRALEGLSQLDSALAAYQEAFEIYDTVGEAQLSLEPLAGEARIRLNNHQIDQALGLANRILECIAGSAPETGRQTPVELPYIPGLEGTTDPMSVYFTCFQALSAAEDERAGDLLRRLNQVYQLQVKQIDDVDLQQAFVNNIRIHRDIRGAIEEADDAAP